MSRNQDKLRVEIVDRLAPVWSGRANYVSIPAVDGRLGILSGRQPILAVLEPGSVEIHTAGEPVVTVSVDKGFASVDSDFVTIVVEGGSLVEVE